MKAEEINRHQLLQIIEILGWKPEKKNQYSNKNNPLSLICVYGGHYKYYEDFRAPFTYFKIGEENQLLKAIIPN